MSTFPGQPKWSEQREKLKKKFSTLTDKDLTFAKGEKDDMMAKLEIKLGKTRFELASIIASL